MFPKGFGGLGNMGHLMKQALDLKANMERLKESLANERVEASSGGGMVTVVMNGKMEVLSLKIERDIIDPAEPEMLETLVAAAVNEATRLAQDRVREKMSEFTGGLDIPGLTS
jgi:hypothetical protein